MAGTCCPQGIYCVNAPLSMSAGIFFQPRFYFFSFFFESLSFDLEVEDLREEEDLLDKEVPSFSFSFSFPSAVASFPSPLTLSFSCFLVTLGDSFFWSRGLEFAEFEPVVGWLFGVATTAGVVVVAAVGSSFSFFFSLLSVFPSFFDFLKPERLFFGGEVAFVPRFGELGGL